MAGACCQRIFCCFRTSGNEDTKVDGQINQTFTPTELSVKSDSSEQADNTLPSATNGTLDSKELYIGENYEVESLKEVYENEQSDIYVALYDFQGRTDGELTFQKGDRMILREHPLESDWLLVEHVASGYVGYVPRNYVVQQEDSLKQQPWYAGHIGRQEAKRRLLKQENDFGTFLVRDSDNHPGEYTLCLLHEDEKIGETVLHYHINISEEGRAYLKIDQQFGDVEELIHYHTRYRGAIARTLGNPCPLLETPLPYEVVRDHFEIDREFIVFEDEIGSGNFGNVFKGKLGIFDVAIKAMSEKNNMPVQEFIREANGMKKLRHENIVRFLGVVSDEPVCIVTEFMSNGDLLSYLRNENIEILPSERLSMCIQIAAGMSYLESKKVVHRDLRAANVLVGDRDIYKVADFGLSRFLDDEEYYIGTKTSVRPIKWTALEALVEHKFSSKSDVWSYAILLHEIFTDGGKPYPGLRNHEMIEMLQMGHRMQRARKCPEKIFKVMEWCWLEDKWERPTFVQISNELIDDGYAEWK